MLETYLLEERWVLVALTMLATGLNVLIVATGQRLFENQELIKQREYIPPGIAGRVTRSATGRIFFPMAFAAAFLAFSLLLDREGFGAVAGGIFVMQAVAALLSLGTLLNLWALRKPGTAVGQLTYSAAYRYFLFASQLLGGTLIVLVAFVIRGGPILLGGVVFLVASTAGYYRRAHQTRRRTGSGRADAA